MYGSPEADAVLVLPHWNAQTLYRLVRDGQVDGKGKWGAMLLDSLQNRYDSTEDTCDGIEYNCTRRELEHSRDEISTLYFDSEYCPESDIALPRVFASIESGLSESSR